MFLDVKLKTQKTPSLSIANKFTDLQQSVTVISRQYDVYLEMEHKQMEKCKKENVH